MAEGLKKAAAWAGLIVLTPVWLVMQVGGLLLVTVLVVGTVLAYVKLALLIFPPLIFLAPILLIAWIVSLFDRR